MLSEFLFTLLKRSVRKLLLSSNFLHFDCDRRMGNDRTILEQNLAYSTVTAIYISCLEIVINVFLLFAIFIVSK